MQSFSAPEDLIGVVLAGGLSSRMGHDKAGITLHGDGTPNLLARTSDLLSALGLEVWISGRRSVLQADGTQAKYFYFEDKVPGLGPLGGISTAMELAAGRPCLVLSCDMPFMDRETLERLIRCRQNRRSGSLLTIYVQADTGYQENLAAIYEPGSLPLLQHCVENKLLKLSRIVPIEQQERINYETEESLPFFNINYPADLEAARRIIRAL